MDPMKHNTTMLERIHMKGLKPHITNNNMVLQNNDDENEDGSSFDLFKPLAYPFDCAWEKVEKLKSTTQEKVEKTFNVIECELKE